MVELIKDEGGSKLRMMAVGKITANGTQILTAGNDTPLGMDGLAAHNSLAADVQNAVAAANAVLAKRKNG